MNLDALLTLSQGVYITGARDGDNRLVGSCIDAVMVVEVAPAQIMVSLGKGSYTREVVSRTKSMSLSVLPADVSDDIIQCFGTQSSRATDKWQGQDYRLREGLPVLQNAVAGLILRVIHTIETASHEVFLCHVLSAEPGTMAEPLTYHHYQQKRKDKQMTDTKKWVCSVCGYVYDGEVPFEELPDDWVCPLCGEPKSVFVQE